MSIEIYKQLLMTSVSPKVCRIRLEEAGSQRVEHFGTHLVANGECCRKEQRGEMWKEPTSAQEDCPGGRGRGLSQRHSGLCRYGSCCLGPMTPVA